MGFVTVCVQHAWAMQPGTADANSRGSAGLDGGDEAVSAEGGDDPYHSTANKAQAHIDGLHLHGNRHYPSEPTQQREHRKEVRVFVPSTVVSFVTQYNYAMAAGPDHGLGEFKRQQKQRKMRRRQQRQLLKQQQQQEQNKSDGGSVKSGEQRDDDEKDDYGEERQEVEEGTDSDEDYRIEEDEAEAEAAREERSMTAISEIWGALPSSHAHPYATASSSTSGGAEEDDGNASSSGYISMQSSLDAVSRARRMRWMMRAQEVFSRLIPLALGSEIVDSKRWDEVRGQVRAVEAAVRQRRGVKRNGGGGGGVGITSSSGLTGASSKSGGSIIDSVSSSLLRGCSMDEMKDQSTHRKKNSFESAAEGEAVAEKLNRQRRRQYASLARRSVLVLSRVRAPAVMGSTTAMEHSAELEHLLSLSMLSDPPTTLNLEWARTPAGAFAFSEWLRMRCLTLLVEALDTNELGVDDEEVASLLLLVTELEDALADTISALEEAQSLDEPHVATLKHLKSEMNNLIMCLHLTLQRLEHAFEAKSFLLPQEVFGAFQRLSEEHFPILIKSSEENDDAKEAQDSDAIRGKDTDPFIPLIIRNSKDMVERLITSKGGTEEVLSSRVALSLLSQVTKTSSVVNVESLLQPFTGILNDLHEKKQWRNGQKFLELLATASLYNAKVCRLFLNLIEQLPSTQQGWRSQSALLLGVVALTSTNSRVRQLVLEEGLLRWMDASDDWRTRAACVRALAEVGWQHHGTAVGLLCLEALRERRGGAETHPGVVVELTRAFSVVSGTGRSSAVASGARISYLFKYVGIAQGEMYSEAQMRHQFLKKYLKTTDRKPQSAVSNGGRHYPQLQAKQVIKGSGSIHSPEPLNGVTLPNQFSVKQSMVDKRRQTLNELGKKTAGFLGSRQHLNPLLDSYQYMLRLREGPTGVKQVRNATAAAAPAVESEKKDKDIPIELKDAATPPSLSVEPYHRNYEKLSPTPRLTNKVSSSSMVGYHYEHLEDSGLELGLSEPRAGSLNRRKLFSHSRSEFDSKQKIGSGLHGHGTEIGKQGATRPRPRKVKIKSKSAGKTGNHGTTKSLLIGADKVVVLPSLETDNS